MVRARNGTIADAAEETSRDGFGGKDIARQSAVCSSTRSGKQESNAPPQDVEQSQELDRISDDEQYQIKVLLRCRSRQQSRDQLKQPDTGAETSTSRDEGRGWGNSRERCGR